MRWRYLTQCMYHYFGTGHLRIHQYRSHKLGQLCQMGTWLHNSCLYNHFDTCICNFQAANLRELRVYIECQRNCRTGQVPVPQTNPHTLHHYHRVMTNIRCCLPIVLSDELSLQYRSNCSQIYQSCNCICKIQWRHSALNLILDRCHRADRVVKGTHPHQRCSCCRPILLCISKYTC
jgi:hypothetical protein